MNRTQLMQVVRDGCERANVRLERDWTFRVSEQPADLTAVGYANQPSALHLLVAAIYADIERDTLERNKDLQSIVTAAMVAIPLEDTLDATRSGEALSKYLKDAIADAVAYRKLPR